MSKAKSIESLEALTEEGKETSKTKAVIEALIIKLCGDVTEGKSRDEFKTLEAIANLYNAVK